jgi:hypothetical protein
MVLTGFKSHDTRTCLWASSAPNWQRSKGIPCIEPSQILATCVFLILSTFAYSIINSLSVT